jgi:hypothetical protein
MIRFLKLIFRYYASTEARWLLYVSVAFLMSVYTTLDKYTNFSDITPLRWFLLFVFSTLQSFIAWRAFIDQSVARDNGYTTTPSLSGKS